jgi:TatA/E family protein of Tat protein translocase
VGPIGVTELIIIFVLALLIFGPRKLPELGRQIGKAMSEFRRASSEIRVAIEDEVREMERQTREATREAEQAVAEAAREADPLRTFDEPGEPFAAGTIAREPTPAPADLASPAEPAEEKPADAHSGKA